jgi:hypothetical protein
MSRIVLAFLAAAVSADPPPTTTAEEALARYRALTGSIPSDAARRARCAAATTNEIIVCASDGTRFRLPMRDAHQRSPGGERILHPGEVPSSAGRVDVAPCGHDCADAPHAPETYRHIWSLLRGEDPD